MSTTQSTSTTSASRDENRLIQSDRDKIAARAASLRTEGWAEFWTIERSLAGAVGCGIEDLRDSELAELASIWEASAR